MKLRILDIVRLGSVNTSQCLPLEICSEVCGVREIPRFEMPLCVCVLNTGFELAAKTIAQPLSQRIQNFTWVFAVEIYENDILVR